MDVFVARQPVFDKKKSLFAYELLFRDGLSNYAPDIDGDIATTKVLSNSFFSIGLNKLSGGKKVFINFTENLINQGVPLLFSPEKTVVEILEGVKPSDQVIASCNKLSSRGYCLALDDFEYRSDMKPLVDIADIIKIDFRLTPIEEIENFSKQPFLNGTKLLAEKVETHEEFNIAEQMGFEYFQGNFFCKPEIIRGREITSSNVNLLRIIAEVNKPDFQFDEVEDIIATDLSISYKLLRYINSAFFNRVNDITSIKQALVYLGVNELRRFVSIIALSIISEDKPNELIRKACIRARFCQQLGPLGDFKDTHDSLFMIGLFSNIDAILNVPMTDIMEKLPLSPQITDVLTARTGDMADYLNLVEHYEGGAWDNVKKLSSDLCVKEDAIPPIYLEACEWANSMAH